jgi:hypothetical protein
MFLAARPISRSSLDVTPIWTSIVEEEFREIQLRPDSITYMRMFSFYVYTVQGSRM